MSDLSGLDKLHFEEYWGESARRDQVLEAIRWLEAEPLGVDK